MFSIFTRARAQLNLSPAERAFLRLIEGFVVAGIVAALPIVSQLLAQQSVNWLDVARLAGGTFAVAFLMAVSKYYKAQADTPLEEEISAVADAGATRIANASGLNDVKTPAPPLPLPATLPVPAS